MITDFYEVTTPPTGFPVTFSKASEWCRDIDAADQTLVESLIAAATKYCEDYTNRVFVDRTLRGDFKVYQESKFEPHLYVELRRAPLISVDQIEVNGVVLDSADYAVSEGSSFSRVLFFTSDALDYSDAAYPIQVSFQAGYGDSASQPDWVQTVIKQIVLFWYENRGDVSTDEQQLIPFVAKAILKQNRILNTYG